jgi:hypothetical protein
MRIDEVRALWLQQLEDDAKLKGQDFEKGFSTLLDQWEAA